MENKRAPATWMSACMRADWCVSVHVQYALWMPDSLDAPGRQLAVADTSSEMRSISLTRALLTSSHFFFGGVGGGNCNWNEWLVRPNNGHRKPPRMQKRLSANALAQRWCINFSVCACRSIPEKLGRKKTANSIKLLYFFRTEKTPPQAKKKRGKPESTVILNVN